VILNRHAPDGMYLTSDLKRLLRVTDRQLQWWDEKGIVSPQQVDHKRRYTHAEALAVALILKLRAKGISLQRCRRNRYPLLHARGDWLVVENRGRFLWVAEEDDLLEALREAKKGVWLIDVKELAGRIAKQ